MGRSLSRIPWGRLLLDSNKKGEPIKARRCFIPYLIRNIADPPAPLRRPLDRQLSAYR